jgi:cysteine desulfurase
MIYLDYASTTKPLEKVIQSITQSLIEFPGNPSSVHPQGFEARKELNRIKDAVGHHLGAEKNQLIFTASGTEANNFIIQGRYFQDPHKRLITTKTEHHSVLKTFEHLKDLGADVVFLGVDEYGYVDQEALKEALSVPTSLVSVLYANNETGVVQDIPSFIKMTHQAGALFHTDMVQVWLHKNIDLKALNPDFATLSAHKFMGPKGVGVAYVKDPASLKPHTYGGRQENQLRAGTENLAFMAGLLTALEETAALKPTWKQHTDELAHYLLEQLEQAHIHVQLNGPPMDHPRFKSILNLSIEDVDAQDLRFFLNQHGVYLSLGSACDSQSITPSHVLQAMFSNQKRLESAMRISLGPYTTVQEIESVVELIKTYLKK